MKLKNVLIVVKDIEKSRQFYQELFGLEMILDNDGKNPGGRPDDDMQSYSYPMIEVFARGGSYGADYYNWGKKNYVPGKTDTRQLGTVFTVAADGFMVIPPRTRGRLADVPENAE